MTYTYNGTVKNEPTIYPRKTLVNGKWLAPCGTTGANNHATPAVTHKPPHEHNCAATSTPPAVASASKPSAAPRAAGNDTSG